MGDALRPFGPDGPGHKADPHRAQRSPDDPADPETAEQEAGGTESTATPVDESLFCRRARRAEFEKLGELPRWI